MPTAISDSRKQSIIDALVRHGIEPSESSVESVVQVMTKDRLGVNEACAKLAGSNGQVHQQKAQKGINAVVQRQVEKAKEVGFKMGRQMTNLTAEAALHQYMTDLSDGTCSSIMMDRMDDLEAAMMGAFEFATNSVFGGENAPLLLESSVQVTE